jgi:membrane-associated phospholipid phosphatase
VRASEWLLITYFVYTSVLALILPLRAPVSRVTISVNLLVLAGSFFLAWADSLRRRELLRIVRDWFPFPLMLLAYREMGWFAQPHTSFRLEQLWVQWDRRLLLGGVARAIESLGPVLPAVLEIAYTLVYTLAPFSVAILYVYRRRERVDQFLFLLLTGVLLAYAQFPYWPSEPPRTVFPGEMFPAFETIFRRFNCWLLGGYGIHTSVFPSAHVSGAFSAAFGMLLFLPERRWVGRFLLVMAVLIATATVYGRYHYLADAVAGFGLALAAAGISRIRSVVAASTALREKGNG